MLKMTLKQSPATQNDAHQVMSALLVKSAAIQHIEADDSNPFIMP